MNKLDICAYIAWDFLRESAPVDTGNLKQNAIRIVKVSDEEYQIIVDADIAPYAVYTNERWVSPKWGGKQNPNEKWIDAEVKNIAEIIASYLGGDLSYVEQYEDERWMNQAYWDAVQRGEIVRDDNIISIGGAVREST